MGGHGTLIKENKILPRGVTKMAEVFRKITYIKKKNIELTEDNVSPEAKQIIERMGNEENLVLRIRVNSPVYIEAAAPLTQEGIKKVTEMK